MKKNKKTLVLAIFSILISTTGYASAEANTTSCSDWTKYRPKGMITPLISSPCDTLMPEWGGLRKDMADSGFYAQVQLLTNMTYDVAGNWNPPPNYAGQRLTTGNYVRTDLTYDLGRIGFSEGSQLYVGGMYAYNNFKPNGQDGHPFFSNLYIYQPLLNNRVALRYGYAAMLDNFYGLYLGTSSASSALGPTSVMLSQSGLTSLRPGPTFDIQLFSENMKWYNHFGIGRSRSTEGLLADSKYNEYGLRWKQPNSGTVMINEIGYKSGGNKGDLLTWSRIGGAYNKSPYLNYDKSEKDDYIYSAYIAATQQLIQTDETNPARGWYIDGKANYSPESKSAFTQDVSLSLFNIGLFDSRPSDMLTIGMGYNKFSKKMHGYYKSNYNITTETYSSSAWLC
ncbi:carbohydrate porin [Klebsiella pneumoniae]|uniref:carbohydrate porin n=1 Tax=Klebsiella pneumoniae TaxID=573 RepID=UPI00210A8E20|nr:carbohydrate porin [Klebsiella pneumoniae]